jgi:pyruvate dehydrogenase E2 component (dihydrolipoamide acetyltransferase)
MAEEQGKRIKESYKIKGLRKFIASKMAESLRDYPQGSGSTYIEIDQLLALKKELKAKNPNISMTSLFVKVTAEALKKHPKLNSALINNEEFIVYDSINIGVGIGLEEGVMMIVIKEAQDKNIFEISEELQEGIALQKQGKLGFDRITGSTFTLSNMGMLGVEQVTAFLTPPETGILAIGATKRQLMVQEDDSAAIKNMTCFSTTINHAAVDGLHAGLFMKTVNEILQNPQKHMGL